MEVSSMDGAILVVEDNAATRELLATNLGTAGYRVCCARDVAEARTLASEILPEVVPLDPKDVATALEGVADDYIIEAFSVTELLARVKALVRRRTRADRMLSRGRPIDEVWCDTRPWVHSVGGHCPFPTEDLEMCTEGADRTALAWG
jgi:DNA-binding response OmpR family regulator